MTDIGTNYHYNFINSENDINNITLIWNTPPTSTSNLFFRWKNIIEIDLSYFDSSQVNNTDTMFQSCSNFMFSFCPKLISLDLSNLDISQVTNMNFMFDECSNLISLYLYNFNSSSVTGKGSMLDGCNILENIYLIKAKINPNIRSSSICSSNLPSNLYIFVLRIKIGLGFLIYRINNM